MQVDQEAPPLKVVGIIAGERMLIAGGRMLIAGGRMLIAGGRKTALLRTRHEDIIYMTTEYIANVFELKKSCSCQLN
jgi:hypothetical protein